MPASVQLMFTEHRARVFFICHLKKLHLHEAVEHDMKGNKGKLKPYIFPDVSSTYQSSIYQCSERIYFEIALFIYGAL